MLRPMELFWTCHICGKERPDKKISVCKVDRSIENKLPYGTLYYNVRYCNDDPDCTRKAPEHRF